MSKLSERLVWEARFIEDAGRFEGSAERLALLLREAAIALKERQAEPVEFTWEDVDALREVVKQARSAWRVYGADHPAAVRAWDVADRLAALLPPREEG